jgi:hypothetical protein
MGRGRERLVRCPACTADESRQAFAERYLDRLTAVETGVISP